jgi:hypothetical protein
MKFGLKQFYEPTPKNLRKFGDIWSWFWGTIRGASILSVYPKIDFICLVLSLAGKAFTNFFADN